MSNKKKNTHASSAQEQPIKLDRKTIVRIFAGALAALMVLGTITMTIMYLFEGGHVH